MYVLYAIPLPHPSPVLDYSGEHNIAMTSNPDGFLRHFHVICSYGLTPYRKSALLLGEGITATCFLFLVLLAINEYRSRFHSLLAGRSHKGRGMQKQSGDLITYVVPPTRGEGDV